MVKENFRACIIKHLYLAKQLSYSELAALTNKSLPLVVRFVNELVEDGVVGEVGYAVSTGGRRPQTYALKSELLYTISVAMDQLITRIALMDMQNKVVGEVEEIELSLVNNPKSLELLTGYLERFIKRSGVSKNKIVGIGIGMPGFVDVNKGINHSFLKPKQGYDIISYIESFIKLPVVIDNDSSLIALAELRFGRARHIKNGMVINIGWGIGLGVIVNGDLFRGANGFAGEFSHIPLFTNNKLCSCGKTGCLETETSLLVIAEKAMDGLKKGKISILKNLSLEHVDQTYKSIMDAAAKGDKFAVELLSEAGYNIGRSVAILIHLLNPELVILSGRGSAAGKIWLAPIQQAINEHCIPKIAENTEVQISSLGYQAELIGAAALVMEHYDRLEFTQYKNRKTKQPA